MNDETFENNTPEAIAIIGMSGRFPGAQNPEEFWRNLLDGVDCVEHFDEQAVEFTTATAEALAAGQKFVRSRGTLADADKFDAGFFGIYPKEAEVMDPQHRLFLECAWEAVERAGYEPSGYPGMIGVYAGVSLNTYLLYHVNKGRTLAGNYQVGEYQTMLGNDKDFLPVRVSYKMNLRGPSMSVQCACSTSLVAICQACTALLSYQTDMALAGGSSISFPQRRDYLYQEDAMVSGDGQCRAFDAGANGTIFGHGVGVVLLKRLSEAVADGDPVLAVIKGWAVNNDGSEKIGFAAPSVNAQADVIAMAQAAAGVEPSSISYIEAHGTGTPLGDPIEVAALTKAFREGGAEGQQFCALGTGKTHIGHLDVAAGATGVIKTVMQLQHGVIPALRNFTAPNPRIDFANSPFYPVAETMDWKRGEHPRRAGVSAFGVGGTNAHVVMEEAPLPLPSGPGRPSELLVLSARTPTALDAMSANLAAHLEQHPETNLTDVSFTLAKGRRVFGLRRAVVAADAADAVAKLLDTAVTKAIKAPAGGQTPPVAFVFPGQGAQFVDMGKELYASEAGFRDAVDECAAHLKTHLGVDIRETLYPVDADRADAEKRINETWLTQPAIFVVEYAMARLWMGWGIKPSLLVGHSIGEYVAAVIAGTFTLESALGLLSKRARLMQDLPGGSMLAVRLGADDVAKDLPNGLAVAAVNSPKLCTVSGPTERVLAYQQALEARKVASRLLPTSHAFHSEMMEPIVGRFTAEAAKIPFNEPEIPWISTCTAEMMTEETLAEAGYWARQLRHAVRFSDAMDLAFTTKDLVMLEVGPGQALAQFVRQHPSKPAAMPVIASLPSTGGPGRALDEALAALGQLWAHGVQPAWELYFGAARRQRVPLPTYPFERQSHWVSNESAAIPEAAPAASSAAFAATIPTITNLTTIPETKPAMTTTTATTTPADRRPELAARLRAMILELSGMSVDDDSASFTELGFDSLFLTQASQAIQSRFSVKVTFRQMLDDLASVEKLVAYLDKEMPATAAKPAAPAVTAASTPAPVAMAAVQVMPGGQASPIEQLMANNIAIMQAMLAEHRGPVQAAAPLDPDALPVVRWPGDNAPSAVGGHGGFKRFGPYKPIEKGEKGGLTPRQQDALDALIARYVAKTPSSKAYTAEHRAHFADPRAVSGFKSAWKEMVYPIVSARSKGSRIHDIDGNEYVDITMGFGTYFFGHSPDWLIEAIEKQLHTGMEIGPQSPIAGELARLVCQFTGMDRATFCNTGSEAVMAAIRLARTITGRKRVVYFTGDYHGMFEEVLVRGSWVNGVYKAQPIAPGIPSSLVENMLVLDYAAPESLAILREHAHEIAAVLVEPVQSRQPDLQPREFMHELRAITAQAGAALIFDEVVTGFRCHPGGAQAYFGVQADMATYGKVVGGGMPIGVLAGKKEYMDALDGGAWNYGDDSFPEVGVTFFAGTFVRHPLAMAAALRVMRYMLEKGPRLQQDITERVTRFCSTINTWFESVQVPIRITHFSAFAGIEHAPDLKYASLLWYFLREKGIHVWEGRPLYFTEAHTDEDFDRIIRAFKESTREMQAAGFLPEGPVESVALVAAAADGFPRVDIAPMTESQREIFYSVQMGDEANCSYNESNIIWFDGKLERPALELAVLDLVARHPALRSTFDAAGEHQLFHPCPERVGLPFHELSDLDAGARESAWSAMLARESGTPFDLVAGPLLRLHLVSHATDRHALLFTAHHMICDGWSFGMIMAELAAAYNARRDGRLAMLPPAMSFADYARLEVREKDSPARVAAEGYWIEQFKDGAPVLELPCDHPRPQVKTYPGAMETRVMDADRFTRLKKAAPKIGGTLFSTLLATFGTLMHRLSGQDEVVVGVPAAGQTIIGCDELVGHCLNFLPMRLKVEGGSAFKDVASDVKGKVLEAYEHQDYTFGSLLKKIKLPRDTSRLPLVSVMFNIDKAGIDQIHFDGLAIDVETNAKQFVNFDIFFNLVQTEHRMIVECEYNTDLFDKQTIVRWLADFEELIEAVLADAGKPLDALPLLAADEHKLLLDEWNATACDYPRTASLHCLVAGVASRVPGKTAVRCGDRSLTYRELEARADVLAARLQASGVKQGDLVGIHLERSTDMVAGLLAILKCGAAYVPMDPAFPAERLGFMVEDAHMPVILSQSSLYRELPPSHAKVLLADELPATGVTAGFADVDVNPEDPAYVIFTSGSTGRPKGVRIPHHAVVNFLNSMRREPGLSPEDVLLSVTTLSFDISGLEIFLPLTTGAETVIATRETVMDGFLLIDAIKRHGITVLQATPVTWRLLLEAGWSGAPGLKMLVGGEAVPRELVNRLAPLGKEIWNVYGPTETTIWSTTTRLEAGEGAVSIGRPIDNTTVYVVNAAMQPQPIGVAGELLIGGDGLALGYHERPDLTADRFIDSPFVAGAKLYRTGDLARWNADGTLECLGRMDHQVKVRGFRIELGEIETCLERHPAIEQAVAHVIDGKLAAYVRTAGQSNTGDGTGIWSDQWDMLYSTAIGQTGHGKLDQLDSVIAGWSGVEGIQEQVGEWIDATVARIRQYHGKRVFEIGCGTGQILARLAADCEAYWAADISKVAVEALEKNNPLPQVKLFHRPADDFSGIPVADFDTVIINSVAQYFPDADYLVRVLQGAARLLKPGGRIFLGDIQGNALMPAQHSEALRERAPAGSTAGQLRDLVDQRLARETELSLDPSWFDLLGRQVPGIMHVETLLRRGKLANETNTYHYDVVLHVGLAPALCAVPAAIDWKQRHLNPEQLEAMLGEKPSAVWLRGIPDARLASAVGFRQALEAASFTGPIPAVPPVPTAAISAEEVFALAAECGYRAHVRWQGDGSDGMMEAVFLPAGQEALPAWPRPLPANPAAAYANAPHHDKGGHHELVPVLRQHLAAHVPEYMIPSAFIFLDAFPLTPNGKVDRKALPAPTAADNTAGSNRAIVGPRDETEAKLLDIWKQVLGRNDIGIHDDIFELGGDSILIFQMTTRATRAGLALTPAQVFRLRTVAALATEAGTATVKPAAPVIQRVNRDAYRRKL